MCVSERSNSRPQDSDVVRISGVTQKFGPPPPQNEKWASKTGRYIKKYGHHVAAVSQRPVSIKRSIPIGFFSWT